MKNVIFSTTKTTAKKIALLLLASCMVLSACSKDDEGGVKDPCSQEGVQEIFTVVEDMPRFPGCEDLGLSNTERKECASMKMLEFVYENLEYPTEAFNNDIEGTVITRFVVNEDGRVCVNTTLQTIDYGTTEEAIRIIELMPNFIPGKQRGEPVKVYINLPIEFEK